jgi:hypothetical protein
MHPLALVQRPVEVPEPVHQLDVQCLMAVEYLGLLGADAVQFVRVPQQVQ